MANMPGWQRERYQRRESARIARGMTAERMERQELERHLIDHHGEDEDFVFEQGFRLEALHAEDHS